MRGDVAAVRQCVDALPKDATFAPPGYFTAAHLRELVVTLLDRKPRPPRQEETSVYVARRGAWYETSRVSWTSGCAVDGTMFTGF